MAVLVAALNNPVWVDFSKSGSQVLARYFDTSDMEVEERFYQQLLLSVELSLRIQAVTSWAEGLEEQSIICSIPEKVAWDLALAKVWQKKMALEPLDDTFHRAPTIFRITALTKNIQKERLLDFARKMKWVGIADVEHILEVTTDGEIPLESRSPHSASWMTGTILPGPSASWLIMKSLIDCDTNVTNSPPGFDQMHSNLGFQHRGNTFWYWKSIVAKVMGACKGVKQDYGWVGPCLPSDDLSTLQVVLVHSESSQQRMSKKYINSMSARSTALGPPADSYPVKEYVLPLPDLINTVDSVRIQKLAFKPRSLPTLAAEPRTCDVAVIFAIGTEVIPIRLRYDVSFISAPPCHGIHPLFWDYAYETVKPDEMILHQRSCNGITVRSSHPSSQATPTTSNSESYCSASTTKSATGPEKMLVVEAFGVADNDVLARAYASFIGVSAIVANVQDTCMACAIRMAYAGSVPMVILNEGHHGED